MTLLDEARANGTDTRAWCSMCVREQHSLCAAPACTCPHKRHPRPAPARDVLEEATMPDPPDDPRRAEAQREYDERRRAKSRREKNPRTIPCTVAGCTRMFSRQNGLARHLRQTHGTSTHAGNPHPTRPEPEAVLDDDELDTRPDRLLALVLANGDWHDLGTLELRAVQDGERLRVRARFVADPR